MPKKIEVYCETFYCKHNKDDHCDRAGRIHLRSRKSLAIVDSPQNYCSVYKHIGDDE